jgi:hypothetical protein
MFSHGRNLRGCLRLACSCPQSLHAYAAVRLEPREDRFAFAGYFTGSAASTTARSAVFTASELPNRANSSGSTIATAKDRRAIAAYFPRGSRLALEKSTSGISRRERLVGSVSFGIGSPFALRGSSGADDPNDTARDALREDDEDGPAELRLAD